MFLLYLNGIVWAEAPDAVNWVLLVLGCMGMGLIAKHLIYTEKTIFSVIYVFIVYVVILFRERERELVKGCRNIQV